MKASVTFILSLPISLKREGKYFVSCCPVLDVWSQGRTKKRAEENLKEAVRLFLFDCYERGTLEKVLKDCGFIPIKEPSKAPKKTPQRKIEVPLPFVVDPHLA